MAYYFFIYCLILLLSCIIVTHIRAQTVDYDSVTQNANANYANTNDNDNDNDIDSNNGWGIYRPNVYFGLRSQSGSSPLFGLLWAGPINSIQHIQNIRHDAEERDQISKYGWLEHDATSYGKQEIIDEKQHVNITTEFILPRDVNDNKIESDRWIARVKALPLTPNAVNVPISLFWYLTLSDDKHTFNVEKPSKDDLESLITVTMKCGEELGDLTFKSSIDADTQYPTLKYYHPRTVYDQSPRYYGIRVKDSWNAKDYAAQALTNEARSQYIHYEKKVKDKEVIDPDAIILPFLPNSINKASNLLIVQYMVILPTTLIFSLIPTIESQPSPSHLSILNTILHGISLNSALKQRSDEFNNKFHLIFPSPSNSLSGPDDQFVKSALSNLIGGIGYFYGPTLIETDKIVEKTIISTGEKKKVKKKENVETSSIELLSAVPSRSFFPRGFMWDEGFHQLLISHFSLPLTLKILKSWFNQIQSNGWLPREQILGEESRRRVPKEFQVQKPTIANPPTLILTIGRIVERIWEKYDIMQNAKEEVEMNVDGTVAERKENNGRMDDIMYEIELVISFLLRIHSSLLRHVDWYFSTQSALPGPRSRKGASHSLDSTTSFRWLGRSLGHCLASGLDDYPRAKWLVKEGRDGWDTNGKDIRKEGEGMEGHVDLHTWMIAVTQTMSRITQFIAQFATFNQPQRHRTKAALKSLNRGKDYYLTLSLEYSRKSDQLLSKLDDYHWDNDRQQYCDYAYRNNTRHFICHFGYISLFPLLLGHIQINSPHLPILLRQLSLTSTIWTKAGLRSLSAEDEFYGSKEDYWRGHIWININYMVAQSLAYYRAIGTNHQAEKQFNRVLHHTTPLSIYYNSLPDQSLSDFSRETLLLISELYSSLRQNLISNIFSEYITRGYLFEQYNSTDGSGRKSHPFTGWTSLVVNLLFEKY